MQQLKHIIFQNLLNEPRKNSGYYSDYKMLRNKVQYEIKKAKTQYYKEIEDNLNNPKNLWNILKDMGAGKKRIYKVEQYWP